MLTENLGGKKLSYLSVNNIKGFPAGNPRDITCWKPIMKGATAVAAELLPLWLEHSVFMKTFTPALTKVSPGLAVY